MKKNIFIIPLLVGLSFTSFSAQASFLEWLFGKPKAPATFRECTAAVFKRDNNEGKLSREYIYKECSHLMLTIEDECEASRLLDHKSSYQCDLAYPNQNGGVADFCEIFGCY